MEDQCREGGQIPDARARQVLSKSKVSCDVGVAPDGRARANGAAVGVGKS